MLLTGSCLLMVLPWTVEHPATLLVPVVLAVTPGVGNVVRPVMLQALRSFIDTLRYLTGLAGKNADDGRREQTYDTIRGIASAQRPPAAPHSCWPRERSDGSSGYSGSYASPSERTYGSRDAGEASFSRWPADGGTQHLRGGGGGFRPAEAPYGDLATERAAAAGGRQGAVLLREPQAQQQYEAQRAFAARSGAQPHGRDARGAADGQQQPPQQPAAAQAPEWVPAADGSAAGGEGWQGAVVAAFRKTPFVSSWGGFL